VAITDGLTLQQAVGDTLGIKLAAHPSLRNAANTLINALKKAKVIAIGKERYEYSTSDRSRLLIPQDAVSCLVNAVLLQGIFAEPKVVVGLITGIEDRAEYATWAREILVNRQSVAGLGLVRPNLIKFLDMLGSDSCDLKKERLPNPFADTLPQMGIGPAATAGSLLRLVATQSAPLSLGDGMMAYYLDGRLDEAYQAALKIDSENPFLQKYRDLIISKYEEAKAFSDLLEDWR
jgi:hypothetical protein